MNRLSTKKQRGFGRFLALGAAAQLAFSLPAGAIDIVLVFDSDASDFPSFDREGDLLTDIMTEAANHWESIIKDSKTVTITYRYTTGTNGLANAQITDTYNDGKPKAGDIDVDTNTPSPWYFDPSPWSDEHWDMQPKLYRDLGASEQSTRFNLAASPPEVLEVSYRGSAKVSAPEEVKNGFDMYTSMLHEIGHILGLNGRYSNPGDTDFLTNATFTGGDAFRPKFYVANDGTIQRGHLNWSVIANNPLMCGSCAETGARRLPTALDIISIASLAGWTDIDLPRMDFMGGVDTDFNTAANWVGNRLPDSPDAAYVRRTGLAKLSSDIRVNSLFVGGQSLVETSLRTLAVNSDTTLQDDQGAFIKPMLLVSASGEFETRNLTIGEDTFFSLDNGTALVTDTLVNEGRLQGNGTLDARDGFFNNGGVIEALRDGLLNLGSPGGDDSFDLDGQGTRETGVLEAHSGDINVNGHLTDPISTEVSVKTGRFVHFHHGWTLAEDGELILDGGLTADPAGRAKIKGRGTLRGTVSVDNHASIISPISGYDGDDPIYASAHTISENAQVSMPDSDDYLTLFGATIEAGAQFTGLGELWSGEGSELNLADRAHVGVTLVNFGHRLTIRYNQVGKVSSHRLKLREQGTAIFDLADLPETGRYDEFSVDRNAVAGGSLEVVFGFSLPPIGTRWPIIKASDSVTGAFREFSYTGLSPFRTASLEYFDKEVHVVIGGPEIVAEVDIPDRVPWDWTYRIPRIPDFDITLEVRHPDIIQIEEYQLVAVGIGTTTLRITLRDDYGNSKVREREITVDGSRPPVSFLTAKGDVADWLAETVDPAGDPHQGRLDVDDDHDGVDRIWEYLHGGSPRGADRSGLSFHRGSAGTVKLHLRLARRAEGQFDLQLERSVDGRYWSPVNQEPAYHPPALGELTGLLSWALASHGSFDDVEELKAAIYRLRIIGPLGHDPGDGIR